MKKKIGSRQILSLILLLITAVIPVFIRTPYLPSIRVMTFYMASASLAWGILGGLTGRISLRHASFMGLGAYTFTLLLAELDISPWISIPLVFPFMGALTALLLPPYFVLRGPYFSLVIIVLGEALRNPMTSWDFAGKGQEFLLPPGDNSLALLRFKSKVPYFYLSFLVVVVVYLIVRAVDRSKFGYTLRAAREDEDTANTIEISPLKYEVLAIFVSCGLIAACDVFYANYTRFINPDIIIQTQSVEFVFPAAIGGIRSVTGPLAGAVILTPLVQHLSSTLSSMTPGVNLLVCAVILIMVILFQPRGIMGWYDGSKFKVRINDMFDKMDGRK